MRWIADRLPREVVYWCLIRAWAYATTGPYSKTVAPEVTMEEVIRRWGKHTEANK